MKFFKLNIAFIGVLIALIGCKFTSTIPSATQALQVPILVTENPTPTKTPTPIKTSTPTPSLTPTNLPDFTATLTLYTQTTSPPSAIAISTQPDGTNNLVIDHQAVDIFDDIPVEFIQAASNFFWLHRHASVGFNIRFGLDCLNNNFPDRVDISRRPFACDKGIDSADIVFDEMYNSTNWIFEPHALPNPNPGWYKKTEYFIERIDNLGTNENFDFASYNMGYVEDPTILDHFFSDADNDNVFPSVFDLEDLENQNPEITIIWWTIALARKTDPHILDFNQQMHEYANTNDKILLDIADIESHLPDGTPCTGVDASNTPTNLTAICPDYTDEKFAGHLNAQGRARMAKSLWVMMALLAGWDGNSP